MRRLLAAMSVLVVGALAALPGATAASAAPALSADLQVSASQASGRIGSSVEVRLSVRNNGPNALLPETWQLSIEAPPGTRLGGGSALAGNCDRGENSAKCRYGFTLRRGERQELRLGLVIQAQPSGCGRVASSYAMDPRDRNNSANIRVTVGGQPRSCFVRGTSSPTPRASKSPTATATPETEITDAPPDDTPASAEVLPALPGNDDTTGGMSMAGFLVIGGGLILVALGGLLIWRLLRKPDDDAEEADDGYAPTRTWNTGTAAYGDTQSYGDPNYGAGPTQYGGPAYGGGTTQYDGGTQQWGPGGDQYGQGRHAQRPPYPPDDTTGPTYGR